MKIAVVGPGAMGCLFAALLSRAGHELWLIDRDSPRASQLAREGLLITGAEGETRATPHATDRATEAGIADLVLIAVKCYDTPGAAHSARPLVAPATVVLTLQNGVGNVEVLAAQLGGERIIGGVTAQAATLLGPGRVNHTGVGETVIGEPRGGESKRVADLSSLLSRAGLPTTVTKDLPAVLWGKLTANAGINAVATLAGVPNGALLDSPALRQAMRSAAGEAAAVGEASGLRPVAADMLKYTEDICRQTAKNTNSMLQDVRRQRRTEIDAINGAVVEQGERVGVKTPTNHLLAALVRGLEQTHSVRVAPGEEGLR